MAFIQFCYVNLRSLRINLYTPEQNLSLGFWLFTGNIQLFVFSIKKKNTEEYNVKTSENDVKHSNFRTGEMDKSREFYSKTGDNTSRFEGKTVPWEHTIQLTCADFTSDIISGLFCQNIICFQLMQKRLNFCEKDVVKTHPQYREHFVHYSCVHSHHHNRNSVCQKDLELHHLRGPFGWWKFVLYSTKVHELFIDMIFKTTWIGINKSYTIFQSFLCVC